MAHEDPSEQLRERLRLEQASVPPSWSKPDVLRPIGREEAEFNRRILERAADEVFGTGAGELGAVS
jgi:DNA-binding transcriptional regulator LsrR (DeoR family)